MTDGYARYMGGSTVHDTEGSGDVVIDVAHHHVHKGEHFFANYSRTLTAAGSSDVLMVTPNTAAGKEVHMTFKISASLNGTFYAYEKATVTGNGTTLASYNSKRSSTNTCGCQWFSEPTGFSAAATTLTLLAEIIGTDSASPAGRTGGRGSRELEWELLVNTKYLFRFTSLNANTRLSFMFDWYEDGD